MTRIAIIGAGAAGICAAKHFLHTSKVNITKLKVYEMYSEIGGTWVYNPDTTVKNCVSSMYIRNSKNT